MTHGNHYLGKLYNDLIANSPQTISMDIPSDIGRGRIAQTKIKHGVILSDWQMCYQADMNVQGPVSKEYMQIIFCLNDGISWGIIDERHIFATRKTAISHLRISKSPFLISLIFSQITLTGRK